MFKTDLSNLSVKDLCNYNSHCQSHDNKILTGGRRRTTTRKRRNKRNRRTRKR